MSNARWRSIPNSTLADQVYEAIRDGILDGELKAGEFAREKQISEAMGVSRTPVREALARLASDGFLEKIPHRGFRVPEEDLSRILDTYSIVAALELLSIRLAFTQVEDQDLTRLRGINSDLRNSILTDDIQKMIDLDNRFHALIAKRSGNRELIDFLSELKAKIRPLETWYYSFEENIEKSVEEHKAIIEALETGNLDRALTIVERNIGSTLVLLKETGHGPETEGLSNAIDVFSIDVETSTATRD